LSQFLEVPLSQLKKEADQNTVGCMSFFSSFAPDNIVQDLKKLDQNDIYSRHESYKIEGDFFESDLWKAFSKTESQESFLDYCVSIDKTDINYWEKIYSRLGITWDDRDEYDEIYFVILNKHLFFNTSQSIDIEESVYLNSTHEKKEIIEENNKPEKFSFYNQYKKTFDRLFWLLFFALGLIFPPIRILIFCLFSIIGVIQLYIWIKEPIENKWSFTLHLFYLILCFVGVFFKQFGFYILFLIIILWIIDIIKDFKKPIQANQDL
jgi:hypothetical protein